MSDDLRPRIEMLSQNLEALHKRLMIDPHIRFSDTFRIENLAANLVSELWRILDEYEEQRQQQAADADGKRE